MTKIQGIFSRLAIDNDLLLIAIPRQSCFLCSFLKPPCSLSSFSPLALDEFAQSPSSSLLPTKMIFKWNAYSGKNSVKGSFNLLLIKTRLILLQLSKFVFITELAENLNRIFLSFNPFSFQYVGSNSLHKLLHNLLLLSTNSLLFLLFELSLSFLFYWMNSGNCYRNIPSFFSLSMRSFSKRSFSKRSSSAFFASSICR